MVQHQQYQIHVEEQERDLKIEEILQLIPPKIEQKTKWLIMK